MRREHARNIGDRCEQGIGLFPERSECIGIEHQCPSPARGRQNDILGAAAHPAAWTDQHTVLPLVVEDFAELVCRPKRQGQQSGLIRGVLSKSFGASRDRDQSGP